jgi:transposase InsO family protein
MAPFRGRLGSEGHAFAANGYFRGTWPRLRTTHLDQAREEIATYIETYHHRPHSGLRYRTPAEVRETWEDGQRLIKSAA